ncbi:hypothetical protein QQP08_024065 [Theobroma cacao]|nr:hypothetical protein QQP08_024065 [Theobroma cacao]
MASAMAFKSVIAARETLSTSGIDSSSSLSFSDSFSKSEKLDLEVEGLAEEPLTELKYSFASSRLSSEKREPMLQWDELLSDKESHLVMTNSATSMFSSIKDSEKVWGSGEAGGVILVGDGDLKKTVLIPFLGMQPVLPESFDGNLNVRQKEVVMSKKRRNVLSSTDVDYGVLWGVYIEGVGDS